MNIKKGSSIRFGRQQDKIETRFWEKMYWFEALAVIFHSFSLRLVRCSQTTTNWNDCIGNVLQMFGYFFIHFLTFNQFLMTQFYGSFVLLSNRCVENCCNVRQLNHLCICVCVPFPLVCCFSFFFALKRKRSSKFTFSLSKSHFSLTQLFSFHSLCSFVVANVIYFLRGLHSLSFICYHDFFLLHALFRCLRHSRFYGKCCNFLWMLSPT